MVRDIGWCSVCVTEHRPHLLICPSCYTTFPATFNHKYCSSCKKEEWLSTYADQIEEYLSVGYSYYSAKQQVIHDIRPDCVICDQPIVGGNPGSLFCTQNKECRTAKRKYKTCREKGMTNDEALRQVLNGKVAINVDVSAAA
jgi:hypothetical protein